MLWLWSGDVRRVMHGFWLFCVVVVVAIVVPAKGAPSSSSCRLAANYINSNLDSYEKNGYLEIDNELAYNCLTSVPVNKTLARRTVGALARMIQFQSTLDYSKSPPVGYQVQPIDLVRGLSEINATVSAGGYDSQYQFEELLSQLFNSVFDGHLAFEGMVHRGVIQWRRTSGLTSLSINGSLPEIYLLDDLEVEDYSTISPITSINHEDPTVLLLRESNETGYHDADARCNAMFNSIPDYAAHFLYPIIYPGNTTFIKFKNGTTRSFMNKARVVKPSRWSQVKDADSFLETFLYLPTDDSVSKREPKKVALSGTTAYGEDSPSLEKRAVASGVPTPFISLPDNGSYTYLSGFFVNYNPLGDIGVLRIQTFVADDEDAVAFQALIRAFIAACQSRDVSKIVIDVSSNTGGARYLRVDAFKQFFPAIDPFDAFEYRAHEAARAMSKWNWNQKSKGRSYRKVFADWDDRNKKPFSSWDDIYGAVNVEGGGRGQHTSLLRADYENTTIEGLVSITGYGELSNYTISPFASSDIVILSNGICSSACAGFVDLMTRFGNVRTIAVGGRPSKDPMQAAGGTKGSQSTSIETLVSYGLDLMHDNTASASDQEKWKSIFPIPMPIQYLQASVNLLDRMHNDSDIPAQFTYTPADCRIFYTPQMVSNITEVWTQAGDIAWGSDGVWDATKCVATATPFEGDTATAAGPSNSDSSPTASRGMIGVPGRPVVTVLGIAAIATYLGLTL